MLETSREELRRSWERSLEDLESLKLDVGEGLLVPAAGAPWFMALFGRDALITGYQTNILGTEPAKNALGTLAGYQATRRDDFRDAEPERFCTSSGSESLPSSGRFRIRRTTGVWTRPAIPSPRGLALDL